MSRYHTHQFVEGEYMKEDEYDLFLNDTSDFLVRCYLPRVYGILAPAGKLPPLNTLMNDASLQYSRRSRNSSTCSRSCTKIAEEAVQWQKRNGVARARTHRDSGYFCRNAHGRWPARPLTCVSDFLRGMRGTMLDMYRCPDKLLRLSR